MFSWITLSFINVILGSIWGVLIKISVDIINFRNVLTYCSIISFCIIILYNILTHTSFILEKKSFMYGIISGVIFFLIDDTISIINNTSYVQSILRLEIIFVTIFSYILFGVKISYIMIFFMCLIVVGCYIISSNVNNSDDYSWLYLGIAASMLSSIAVLLLKHIYRTVKNITIPQILFNKYIGVCTFSIINQLVYNKSLVILDKNTSLYKNYTNAVLTMSILFASIIFSLYQIILMNAVKLSKNPSYPLAIMTLSIVGITLLNMFLPLTYKKKTDVTLEQWVGIILIILGIFGVSFIN